MKKARDTIGLVRLSEPSSLCPRSAVRGIAATEEKEDIHRRPQRTRRVEMIGPGRSAGAGMRSRASGAARLEASSCCFSERAFALSELWLFSISFSCFYICTFSGRAAPDRAGARPISIYLIIALSAGGLEPWSPRSGQGRTPKKYLSKATVTSKGLSW